ncbi:MAG: flavin monoamine oxidase family protein [Flammeovirgaceae bacterium]
MDRREFIRRCAIIGAGMPLLSSMLMSCEDESIVANFDVNFSGKVLVIGAGAAGLIAGHILNKHHVDFEILEASSVFGGRVKKIDNFADFPIDLGAEWIHDEPKILSDLLNDPSETRSIEFIVYNPKTVYVWSNNKLKKRNLFSNFYSEYKFKNTTWYDYFDQFIVPSFSDKIRYNKPVNSIDYSADKVVVTTADNDSFEADKILLTVPATMLQQNKIAFTPSLPTDKVAAFNEINMPDGIKVFMEFSERFYPDIVYEGSPLSGSTDGEKVYYDAAFGKNASKNIFALFAVGEPSAEIANLPNDAAIIEFVLNELDQMFEGKASATYVKHVIQNWTKEPYIQGSYSHNDVDIEVLARPLDEKIYFAGEAYSELASATVHGAGASAYVALEQLLK